MTTLRARPLSHKYDDETDPNIGPLPDAPDYVDGPSVSAVYVPGLNYTRHTLAGMDIDPDDVHTLVSQQSVNYREGTSKENCGNCSMFMASSNACDLVTGFISPDDTCDEWAPCDASKLLGADLVKDWMKWDLAHGDKFGAGRKHGHELAAGDVIHHDKWGPVEITSARKVDPESGKRLLVVKDSAGKLHSAPIHKDDEVHVGGGGEQASKPEHLDAPEPSTTHVSVGEAPKPPVFHEGSQYNPSTPNLVSHPTESIPNTEVVQHTPTAPIEVKPAGQVDKLPSFSELQNYKKVPGPSGSNPIEWRQAPDGRTFAVKPTPAARAYNEIAAGLVYKAAGVNFPNTSVVKDSSGKTYVVSEKVNNLHALSPSQWMQNPDLQAKAAKDYGVDALLSHWDVHGLSADNTLVNANNEPVRIESGGAMAFRAMGAPKPSFAKGQAWVEPKSMRESEQGRRMYGKMSDQQAADSLKAAAALNIDDVKNQWIEAGVPAAQADQWAAVLKERQAQIPNIVAKLTGEAPASASSPSASEQWSGKADPKQMAKLHQTLQGAGVPKQPKQWNSGYTIFNGAGGTQVMWYAKTGSPPEMKEKRNEQIRQALTQAGYSFEEKNGSFHITGSNVSKMMSDFEMDTR